MSDSDGYNGTQRSTDGGAEYNAMAFVIRSILDGRSHAALVQIVNVNAPGGVAMAGTVDVQPLVNQLDGNGNAIPHGVVNGLPYQRMQGGANAIILDPVKGDIGIAVFCDRDISSVQSSRAAANPQSGRRNDMADGVYLGGLLNAVPTQFVQFGADFITLTSTNNINLNAKQITLTAPKVVIKATTSVDVTTPTFTVNGAVHVTGTSALDGAITAGANATVNGTLTASTDVVGGGKSLATHYHMAQGATSPTSTPKP